MLRRSRFSLGVVAASLTLAASAVVFPSSQSSAQLADTSDLDAQQLSVHQEQAALAAELDVLHASSDQVGAAIATLDGNVTVQADQTDRAVIAADAARAVEAAATASVATQQAEVDRLEALLSTMAVNLYIRPPTDDLVHAFVHGNPNDAPVSMALVRFRIEDVSNVKKAAEQARDQLASAQRAAVAAREQADAAAHTEQARLVDLQTALSQQRTFAGEVNDRIERAIGEAAMLADQDASLSEEIQQRELQLASQLQAAMAHGQATVLVIPVAQAPAEAPAESTTTTGAPPTSAAPPATGAPQGTAPPPPPTTAAPAPTTTAPATRTIILVPVDTAWVGGIEVAAWLAPNVQAMLDAAANDGITLTGSGYRNVLDQIEIRREVCGPTDYDIFEKPSYECSPPVAIPGRSNHEKGVAIDFSGADGDLIRTRDHPAYLWLAAHAAAFGLYNLPAEPWHWSIDGH